MKDLNTHVIYDADALTVSRSENRFYVRYDAGPHQIAIREDEISEAEAQRIMAGPAEATSVLFELQKRLTQAGLDPYASNTTS